MKILHIIRSPHGGAFRHVKDLSSTQALKGHEVHLITGEKGVATPKTEPHTIPIKKYSISSFPTPKDIFNIINIVLTFKSVDIIHGHGAMGGVYARLTALILSKKCFYTPHGGSFHYTPTSLYGRFIFSVEKILSKITSGIIFESDYSKKIFVDHFPDSATNQRVIYNGLSNNDFFYPARVKAEAIRIGYIGELRELKGIHILLKSLSLINGPTPIELFIAGDGDFKDELVRLRDNLGLTNTKFLGYQDFKSFIPNIEILICPSLKDSFPYVILESIASNTPVIATTTGGIPEIFGKKRNLFLVKPNCPVDLKIKIEEYISNPLPFQQYTTKLNLELSKNFTLENNFQEILEFYHSTSK